MTTSPIELANKALELSSAATTGPVKAFENGSWGGKGFGVAVTEDTKKWFTCESNSDESAKEVLLLEFCRNHIDEIAKALIVRDKQARIMADSLSYIGHECMHSEDGNCPSRQHMQISARNALADAEKVKNE